MKLIDKDKVVAEIERRIADNKKDIELALHENLQDYFEGYEDALVLLKQQYLDTIETKEVDEEYNDKAVFHVLENGVKQDKRELVDKACEFFAPYIPDNSGGYDRALVIERFKNYINYGG